MFFTHLAERPVIAIALILITALPLLAGAGNIPITPVADIPLTGGTTRLDYASLDPRDGRLFIAHLGDSMVTVFDTAAGKVVQDIPGVGRVHGVLVVPELDRVYASATQTNEVVAIDENSLKVIARIPGGYYPDGMAYVPALHKLYVSDEAGGTETIIDTSTNTCITTLQLGGEAGNTQYDPASGHIFVNVQTTGDLVEIDPESDKIVSRHPLSGARGNHGLLIDAKERLAFVACEDNDMLLVFDLRSMRVVSTFDVGSEPDVLAFDPGLHWLYVASEKGAVSMFGIERGVVSKLGEAIVGENSHIVAVDPRNHRVYFPLKDVHGRPMLRIMEPLPSSGS